MKFFKNDAPIVEDYEKTRDELIEAGWLSKIYNVEKIRSVYDTTDLGYQYYFAMCMETGHKQLFNGPKLAQGQNRCFINEDIDLIKEGFIIEGIDAKKLTPKAAEYLYVLTDAHGKNIQATIKLTNDGHKKNDTDWGTKLGKGFASFMKGMQGMSKMAQQYDKSSTKATRSAWGSDNSYFPTKRTLGSKKRKKSTKKRRYRKS